MNGGYINLELDKIKLEQKMMNEKLVKKASLLNANFLSSSVYQQLNLVGKHNISRLINKVSKEIEGVKNTLVSFESYVSECHDNYLNLDTFLASASSGVTTSSLTNSVIGNMSTLDYINLDFQIPDSRIKLDYEFTFHPVEREEKKTLEIFTPPAPKQTKHQEEEM